MEKTRKSTDGWQMKAEDNQTDTQKMPVMIESNQIDPIERYENNIYFYSEVYRDSVLKLNKDILLLNNELTYRSIVTKNKPADIYLHIQSYGGSIFSGLSAMDTILKSGVKIVTIIDGCAASSATLISLAGEVRLIKEHSFILIHQLSSAFWGNYEQLKDDMQNADTFMEVIKNVYKQRTKIPMKKLNEILKRDLWLTPKEALEYGLVDGII